MKDLIIGIFIGVLITTGIFSYSTVLVKVAKLEARTEMLCKDVERIASKVGPLPEAKRK